MCLGSSNRVLHRAAKHSHIVTPVPGEPTQWDINLRANLRLWPEPLPNLRALARAVGGPWDEEQIALNYFAAAEGEDRRRAVRQTFEAMAYEGLVYRSDEDVLHTTVLGEFVLTFLGLLGPRKFVNGSNRVIVAGPLIRGLAIITEVRVIWTLMRGLDNSLSNEELNRAMARIDTTADVPAVVKDIRAARAAEDPSLIGARLYDDDKFGTDTENAQRKAMNPHFLLAGGGGLFIDVAAGERTLLPASARLIDGALRSRHRLIHADTTRRTTELISRASLAPKSVLGRGEV